MSKETLSLCKHGRSVKLGCTSCYVEQMDEEPDERLDHYFMPDECIEDILSNKW